LSIGNGMNVFLVVLQSVLALIGIGVLGFWILKRGIIPDHVIVFLSRLAIDIALPCVVFAGIVLNFDPKKIPDWWQLPLWWAAFEVVAICLTLLAMFASQKSTRSEFALSLFFQNGFFFPLIVVTGLFGTASPYGVQLFIFILFHPVLFFTTAHLFFKKKGAEKRSLNLARVINPVLVSTTLAVALKLLDLDVYLPRFLITMLTMVGSMTLPLLMIILGGSLYIDFQKKGKIYFGELFKFVLVKNFLYPLVFIALLILVHPGYNIALLMLLEAAVPPITGTSIQAERAGGSASIANQFILASFAVSIISIPLMFTLYSRFFPAP
jgi:malate permease and related proteins